MKVIELNEISKVFFTDDLETRALSNIDLSIERGEFLSIAGPSGCGKSTLLSIIGLLDIPNSGSYSINGEDVSSVSEKKRSMIRNRDVGFIFQSFNLIADLNVFENVELPLIYKGVEKQERKKRVAEVLNRTQISHRATHLPSQLSGGQQQRVAIARALSTEPKILLADEPTGNLDSENGEKAMGLLKELHEQGATICMVTHDTRYNAYASRVVNLFDGKIGS